MDRILAAIVLGGAALAQVPRAGAQSVQIEQKTSTHQPSGPGDVPGIPQAPHGKSTIFGGEIRDVDPVRDVLTLKTFGERPMKILFDERTQVFLDGKKVPLRSLLPSEHASIQTTLDGADVFALSVHILSHSPEGHYEGRILSFNPATGELELDALLSHVPLKLMMSNSTSITRKGQAGFSAMRSGGSDLVRGSIVSVKFQSGTNGRGVASEVTVLAVPGAQFVFDGDLANLDLHAGLLVLIDPRDKNSYEIHFDPNRLPVSQSLRPGQNVRVSAGYDGTHYTANDITAH